MGGEVRAWGVLKLLLDREEVNPGQADIKYGRTPLLWAAEEGHEAVVKMLLGREEVNPDQPNTKYGRTPLSWAAMNGRAGVVKVLLDREDVNPNQADKYGQTPISWAGLYRYKGVVKMLRQRDANSLKADIKELSVQPALPSANPTWVQGGLYYCF